MIAKKIALGFGIAFILPLLLHYGVSTFVHQPRFDEYRTPVTTKSGPNTQEDRRNQQDLRDAAEKRFEIALFWVAVPVGLAAIIIGALLRAPAIGAGLMFGGIFSVAEGYMSSWSKLPDGLKFGSLLAAFAVLLVVGYRKLEKDSV